MSGKDDDSGLGMESDVPRRTGGDSGKNVENRAESLYREYLQLIKKTDHFMEDMSLVEQKQGSLRMAYSDMVTKVEIAREELEELADVLDGIEFKMRQTVSMSDKFIKGKESLSAPSSFNQSVDRPKVIDRRSATASPVGSGSVYSARYSDDMDDNLSQNLEAIDDDDI